MGTFTYDSTVRIDLDDAQLIHLELVILAKLRRGERFSFSWNRSQSDGGGRSLVWINDSVPLAFDYTAATMPEVNQQVLEKMSRAANSTRGLRILDSDIDLSGELSPNEQYDLTYDGRHPS